MTGNRNSTISERRNCCVCRLFVKRSRPFYRLGNGRRGRFAPGRWKGYKEPSPLSVYEAQIELQ